MKKLIAIPVISLCFSCADDARDTRKVPQTPQQTQNQRADLKGTEDYKYLSSVFKNQDQKLAFGEQKLVIEKRMQVGKDGDENLPYPTYCKLQMSSSYKVLKPIQEELDFLVTNNYRTPDFKIFSQIESFKLISSDDNSEKCSDFVTAKNDQILLGVKFEENRYFQKISNTQIDNVISNTSYSSL